MQIAIGVYLDTPPPEGDMSGDGVVAKYLPVCNTGRAQDQLLVVGGYTLLTGHVPDYTAHFCVQGKFLSDSQLCSSVIN